MAERGGGRVGREWAGVAIAMRIERGCEADVRKSESMNVVAMK